MRKDKQCSPRAPRKVLCKLLFITLAPVVLVLVVALVFYAENTVIANSMKSHLERKYSESFSVKNVRKEGSGLGVSGQAVGDASPTSNSSVVFRISDTDGRKYDNYVGALWRLRSKSNLEQMIRESFDQATLKRTDIHIGVSGDIDNLHNSLKNEELRDSLKKYSDSIGITVSIEPAQDQEETEALKDHRGALERLARRLYDFGFRSMTLVYDFVINGQERKDMRCVLSVNNMKEGGFTDKLEYRCIRR